MTAHTEFRVGDTVMQVAGMGYRKLYGATGVVVRISSDKVCFCPYIVRWSSGPDRHNEYCYNAAELMMSPKPASATYAQALEFLGSENDPAAVCLAARLFGKTVTEVYKDMEKK